MEPIQNEQEIFFRSFKTKSAAHSYARRWCKRYDANYFYYWQYSRDGINVDHCITTSDEQLENLRHPAIKLPYTCHAVRR